MINTDFEFGTLQARACLMENTRPFLWVGLACVTFGYIPHVHYGNPVLLYLGLVMLGAGYAARLLSGPLIAMQRAFRQLRGGLLRPAELVRRVALLVFFGALSLAGTAVLARLISGLSGLP